MSITMNRVIIAVIPSNKANTEEKMGNTIIAKSNVNFVQSVKPQVT